MGENAYPRIKIRSFVICRMGVNGVGLSPLLLDTSSFPIDLSPLEENFTLDFKKKVKELISNSKSYSTIKKLSEIKVGIISEIYLNEKYSIKEEFLSRLYQCNGGRSFDLNSFVNHIVFNWSELLSIQTKNLGNSLIDVSLALKNLPED